MLAAAGYLVSPLDLIPEAVLPGPRPGRRRARAQLARHPPGRGDRGVPGVGEGPGGAGRLDRAPRPVAPDPTPVRRCDRRGSAGPAGRRTAAPGRPRRRPCPATSCTDRRAADLRCRGGRAAAASAAAAASPRAPSSTGARPRRPSSTGRGSVLSRRDAGATVDGMTADITLRGPGDVVAILPYQLGLPPARQRRGHLPARETGGPGRPHRPPARGHVDEVVSTLMGPLVRDGATSVIVVGYEDEPDTSHPLLLALVEQLERAGIDVVDVAVVRDGRRYSPICSEPCCPPEGVALPDPADVPGVAEYVALGRSPLRVARRRGGPGRPRAVAVPRVSSEPSRRARGCRVARRRSVAAWRAVLDPGERGRRPPDRRAVADLALGLADIPWRDGLIAWLVPSVLPTELDRPEGRWRCCGRRCRRGAAWGAPGARCDGVSRAR